MVPSGQSQKKSTRSMLFWIFVVLAIPLGIAVLAIAGGYRFDERTGAVTEKSALAIHTLPKNADVRMNGELQDQKTPYIRVQDPGLYTVTVEYNGYHPWTKTMTLAEGRSEIFSDILLFQKTLPVIRDLAPPVHPTTEYIHPVSAQIAQMYKKRNWPQPDGLLVYEGPVDLLIDPLGSSTTFLESVEEFSPLHTLNDRVIDAEWQDSSVLLYMTSLELWIYDHRTRTHTLLTRRSTPLVDATWHPNGAYIFFSDEGGLYALEIDARDQRQVWQLSTLPSPSLLTIEKENFISFQSGGKWYEMRLY